MPGAARPLATLSVNASPEMTPRARKPQPRRTVMADGKPGAYANALLGRRAVAFTAPRPGLPFETAAPGGAMLDRANTLVAEAKQQIDAGKQQITDLTQQLHDAQSREATLARQLEQARCVCMAPRHPRALSITKPSSCVGL